MAHTMASIQEQILQRNNRFDSEDEQEWNDQVLSWTLNDFVWPRDSKHNRRQEMWVDVPCRVSELFSEDKEKYLAQQSAIWEASGLIIPLCDLILDFIDPLRNQYHFKRPDFVKCPECAEDALSVRNLFDLDLEKDGRVFPLRFVVWESRWESRWDARRKLVACGSRSTLFVCEELPRLLKEKIMNVSGDSLDYGSFDYLPSQPETTKNVNLSALRALLPCVLSIKTWCYDDGDMNYLCEVRDLDEMERFLVDICFGRAV